MLIFDDPVNSRQIFDDAWTSSDVVDWTVDYNNNYMFTIQFIYNTYTYIKNISHNLSLNNFQIHTSVSITGWIAISEQDLKVSCGPQPIAWVPSSHTPQLFPANNEGKFLLRDSREYRRSHLQNSAIAAHIAHSWSRRAIWRNWQLRSRQDVWVGSGSHRPTANLRNNLRLQEDSDPPSYITYRCRNIAHYMTTVGCFGTLATLQHLTLTDMLESNPRLVYVWIQDIWGIRFLMTHVKY